MAEKNIDGPQDLQTVLCVMDLVRDLQSQREKLKAVTEAADQKQAMRGYLRQVYDEQGVEVGDETIERAVESFFSRRFEYQPGDSGWQRVLAGWYVRRMAIARAASLCLSAVAVVVLLCVSGGRAVDSLIEGALAKEVATALAATAEFKPADGFPVPENPSTGLAQGVDLLRGKAAAAAREVEFNLQALRRERQVLEKTPQSERDAVRGVLSRIHNLQQQGETARRIYAGLSSEAQNLIDARRQGDRYLADLPESVSARLDAELEAALALAEAQPVRQALDKIKGARQFADNLRGWRGEINRLAEDCQAVAAEPAAKEMAERLAREARAALARESATDIQAKLAELKALSQTLNASYELVIDLKEPAIWRYPDGNRSHKDFYFIVKAEHNGAPVPVLVRNQENGATATVSRWAEQVDEAEYEEAHREYNRTGTIKDTRFGGKLPGGLSVEYARGIKKGRGDTNTGCITRW